MICTEADAKTKWCPKSDVSPMAERTDGKPVGKCIGSACMLWGWVSQAPRSNDDKPQRGKCGLSNHHGEYTA